MEFSMTHILILLVIALLVFGARRIPEIGASLGQGIKEFKKSLKEIDAPSEQRSMQPPAQSSSTPLPPTGSGEPKRLNQ